MWSSRRRRSTCKPAIVGMATVSSYDCRSRYGDQNQRLSEHAYVNALDVSEFVTEKGERIAILELLERRR